MRSQMAKPSPLPRSRVVKPGRRTRSAARWGSRPGILDSGSSPRVCPDLGGSASFVQGFDGVLCQQLQQPGVDHRLGLEPPPLPAHPDVRSDATQQRLTGRGGQEAGRAGLAPGSGPGQNRQVARSISASTARQNPDLQALRREAGQGHAQVGQGTSQVVPQLSGHPAQGGGVPLAGIGPRPAPLGVCLTFLGPLGWPAFRIRTRSRVGLHGPSRGWQGHRSVLPGRTPGPSGRSTPLWRGREGGSPYAARRATTGIHPSASEAGNPRQAFGGTAATCTSR